MTEWLERAVQRAQQPNQQLPFAWQKIRQHARQQLQQSIWPTRKTEAWKYTSLYQLGQQSFELGNIDGQASEIADLSSIDIVFDGQAWRLPKQPLPAGISIRMLSDEAVLPSGFASIKPARHLFGQVNDALFADALIIEVAADTTIEPVVRLCINNREAFEQHARAFVSVSENAKLTVLEQLEGTASGLTNTCTEFELSEYATLNHYRLQLQTEQSYCVGGDFFRLAQHSKLNSHIIGFGAAMSRLDVDVEHAGEHALATMNAIYLLDGEEHFDLHTTIEHAVAHGTTEENVRGIVADRAQAVFNGRIHIHRDAQKTLAELNNRNLLLSRRAEINTKPELEIYADDVRCAHGATVAEIDDAALYYLTSRGINKAEAMVMLNFGFVNELVEQMPDEPIAALMRKQLRQRFSTMQAN